MTLVKLTTAQTQMKTTCYMQEVSIKLAKCNLNFAILSSEKCVNIMVPLTCRIMNFDFIMHILLTSNILKA